MATRTSGSEGGGEEIDSREAETTPRRRPYYLKLRPSDEPAEGVLVAWGVTLEGQKVLLGLALGSRESYESWLGFGRDLIDRGLRRPALVIADGAPGLWEAARELWPSADEQRCTGRSPSAERGRRTPSPRRSGSRLGLRRALHGRARRRRRMRVHARLGAEVLRPEPRSLLVVVDGEHLPSSPSDITARRLASRGPWPW